MNASQPGNSRPSSAQNPAVRAAWANIAEYLYPTITQFIQQPDDDDVSAPLGSGVLLQIADEYFVITAAHVVAAKFEKLPIAITSGNEKPAIWLTGSEVSAYTALNPVLDVAALHLTHKMGKQLQSEGKRFHRLCETVELDAPPQAAWYALFGFAGSKTTLLEDVPGLLCTASFHCTTTHDNKFNELNELPNFDANIHIPLHFDRREVVDSAGQPIVVPDPHGMSGCGVWRLTNSLQQLDRCAPKDCKLVGILTHWLSDSKDGGFDLLRATKFGIAIEAIYRVCPDLRRPIELNYPNSIGWNNKSNIVMR
jgi:hypothetical protein